MPFKTFGSLAGIPLNPTAGDEYTALDTKQKFTSFVDGSFEEDSVKNVIFGEIPGGAINGVNDTFTLVNTPLGTIDVSLNGLLQKPGAGNDYQLSGSTITFEPSTIPIVGDVLAVSYKF